MIPMVEPATELTLESPAGLIRVDAECADGKVTGVTFRNVPAFATHLDAAIEVPTLGTVTVDVAYGGMCYVMAEAERVRAAAHAGRGRRHRADLRDDQDGRPRAVARGPPREAEDRRRLDRAAVGAAARPGERAAGTSSSSRRATFDWDARPPGPVPSTARRAGPGPVRGWRSSTRAASWALARLRPRGHPGHDLHRPPAGGDDRRAVPGGRPDDQRPGLDHGLRSLRPGRQRPVPRGVHRRRHLGVGAVVGGKLGRAGSAGRRRRPPQSSSTGE